MQIIDLIFPQNHSTKPQLLMIDYIVCQKANGTKAQSIQMERNPLTADQVSCQNLYHQTHYHRKYYSGQHSIEIQINGQCVVGRILCSNVNLFEFATHRQNQLEVSLNLPS